MVNAGPGEAELFSTEGKRNKLWLVKWQKGQVRAPDADDVAIDLETVSGTIFRDSNPAADFRGATGLSDKKTQVLRLEGGVEVVSKEYQATMKCDRLRYEGKLERITAEGTVRIQTKDGNITMQGPIYANPELTKIGSPEVYEKL